MENKQPFDSGENSTSSIEKPQLNEQGEEIEDFWDEIGYHKPLAGFWYRLVLQLIAILISAVLTGSLLSYFYPFPESWGYRDIAAGLFTLFFVTFDLGTHMCMDRFIADAQIKDPGKMIKYIQFFIWYQMITGLIQITCVSIYALYFVPESSLSYTVWLMLIVGSTQYPGFLGVFKGVLGSLQQYGKTEMLNFLTGTLLQRLTELGFLVLGRMYGEAHPQIGAMMGIAIGSCIGLYVDDFIAMIVSAFYFTKTMKKFGYTAISCFKITFDWKLVKEVLIFGFKTGVPGLVGVAVNLAILTIWLDYLPQYATFKILLMVGGSIGNQIEWANGVSITPLVAESYLNGKKKLCQYYLGQNVRFSALVQGFLFSVLLIVSLILPIIFVNIGMAQYLIALVFVVPAMLSSMPIPYANVLSQVIVGSNNPNINIVIGIISDLIRLFTIALTVMWLRMPITYGMDALIWILTCGEVPAYIFRIIASYIFVNKKVFKIKIPGMQAGFAIGGATVVTTISLYLMKELVFLPLTELNFTVGLILFIFVALFTVLFVYFPMTALLGGWDDVNVREFGKAAKMSGPSKFIVWPIFKSVEYFTQRSKLHGKFAMDSKEAFEEAEALYQLKVSNSKDFLATMK
jgi:hypothetical protein